MRIMALHMYSMAQGALSNMPKAPQGHPDMAQTRTNEENEDNVLFFWDVPEDCTYWGEIVTDNRDSGYFHIKPGHFQNNDHPPTGNIFAHFYENPEFEIAGLLF